MGNINYQEALHNAAKSMVRVKSPEHLIKMITRYIDKMLGYLQVSMIIHDARKKHYVFCDSQGVHRLPISLLKFEKDTALILWFSNGMRHKYEQSGILKRDYLTRRQLDQFLHDDCVIHCDITVKKQLEKIREQMSLLKASLCIPGYCKGELMCILLLGEKKDRSDFTSEEIAFLQTLANDASITLKNAEFEISILEKVQELESSLKEITHLRKRDKGKYLQTLLLLAQMVDARDPYTYGHSEEIKKLGMLTAYELGIDTTGEKGQILSSSLLLHDIGKLGISDKILHKPGGLTDDEWMQMREHVRIGARILENHEDFQEVSIIVMHHHENFNGTGYPYKLLGKEIPIQSRIIGVVDAFHAMVSDRPYRKGLTYDQAIEELNRCAGSQFDPDVVQAFLKIIRKEINS